MIKLTKTIAGKKVVLDIISLNGKSVVRDKALEELAEKGITRQDLEDAGFGIEKEELGKIEASKL